MPCSVNLSQLKLDCHLLLQITQYRSVHIFYRRWFEENLVNDFSSKDQAREVYQSAREAIQV